MEVVKQQNKTSMDKMEMTNTTLEDEAKMKACSLHLQVVGWAKEEAHKKMLGIFE